MGKNDPGFNSFYLKNLCNGETKPLETPLGHDKRKKETHKN